MKVLIFVRSLDVGGTERQVTTLARGLADRRHDVVVVELYAGGAMEAHLAGTGVRLVAVEKRSRWDVFGPLWRLRRLFAAERPDVIYSFLPMQNVLAALLRPGATRAPLVFGARASGMQMAHYDRLSAISYRAEAPLSACADVIVANAEVFRGDAEARGFRNKHIVVIPNAIDTDNLRIDPEARRRQRAAWTIGDDAFVVGMVARLDPMKDHPNFLAAAADFVKRHGDAHFVCAGGGPAAYRARLEGMACDLGIGDRVSFVGDQRDVAAAYNAFDIATLSSAFGEGFPNVIGEAMACGTPVVATDVGDARRIVGDYGVVVPPRNSTALSEGWTALRRRLAGDAALRQSARGRIVDVFGVNAMVESTERVLSEAAART